MIERRVVAAPRRALEVFARMFSVRPARAGRALDQEIAATPDFLDRDCLRAGVLPRVETSRATTTRPERVNLPFGIQSIGFPARRSPAALRGAGVRP
jgi:hypothetical protein